MKLCVAYAKYRRAEKELEIIAERAGALPTARHEPQRPLFLPPPLELRRSRTRFLPAIGAWWPSPTTLPGASLAAVAAVTNAKWTSFNDHVRTCGEALFFVRGWKVHPSLLAILPGIFTLLVLIFFFPQIWQEIVKSAAHLVVFDLFFGSAQALGTFIGKTVVAGVSLSLHGVWYTGDSMMISVYNTRKIMESYTAAALQGAVHDEILDDVAEISTFSLTFGSILGLLAWLFQQ